MAISVMVMIVLLCVVCTFVDGNRIGSAWVYNAHYVLGHLPDGRFWLAWQFEREFSEAELSSLIARSDVDAPNDEAPFGATIGDPQRVRSEIAAVAYPMCHGSKQPELDNLSELMRLPW